jgi:transaldolase
MTMTTNASTTFHSHDSALARAVASFCLEGHGPPPAGTRARFPASELWAALASAGSSIWLDTGDVDAIRSLWTREMVALTTNNTLLNKEVQKGIYDRLVPRAAAMLRAADAKLGADVTVLEIAFILNAVHGLSLVRAFDADVSVELHTDLAHDAEASYQYGKRFHAICPERFIVKVPLTPDGLFAARRLRRDGIRVNFTLGFSARQNHLTAVVARPSWVNVFMGRLNSFVIDHGLGDGKNVGEKATLASQRVIRRLNKELKQEVRQIGASIRNGQQVFDLAGVDVLTIPTTAAAEFVQLAPAPRDVRDRTAADPPVAMKPGLDAAAEGLDVFWGESASFRDAMSQLGKQDLDRMTGATLRTFLGDHRCGDLFPRFSEEEQVALHKEGKIPSFTRWAERVRRGTASWDGMMTAAALASFAVDQKALDERIRRFL